MTIISQLAPNYGFDNALLCRLVKILIAPTTKTPLNIRNSIIREYLLPRSQISNNIVITILGIKYGPRSSTQASVHQALLKWLVIVYPFLENLQIVTKLYSTLLTKVPYEYSRQWVCHLLYLSTTQTLVTAWRAQLITEYYTKFPSSPYIAAILRLYKAYAPFLFKGNAAIVKTTIFQSPNIEMEKQIYLLHEKIGDQTLNNNTKSKSNKNISQFSKVSNGKSKSSITPSTTTATTTSRISKNNTLFNPIPLVSQHSLGVENINSIDKFVSHFYKLKFPDQMGMVLSDSGMLIRLLLYKGTAKEWDRFNSWLLQELFDCLQYTPTVYYLKNSKTKNNNSSKSKNTTEDSSSYSQITQAQYRQLKNSGKPVSAYVKVSNSGNLLLESYLGKILTFYTYTKVLPYAVEEFIYEYLSVWDGNQHSLIMFHLIGLLPMPSYEVVENQILEPLKRIVVSNLPSKQIYVFDLLTNLIRNWRLHHFTSKERLTEKQIHETCRTLRSILAFSDYYGLFAVEKFRDNISISMSVISLFKEIAMFPYHEYFPIVLSMSPDLLYYLFLSRSGVLMSQCSDLLVRWKPLNMNTVREKPLDKSVQFQSFVLDFCNAIWLNKPFDVPEKGAPLPSPDSTVVAPCFYTLEIKFINILKEIASKNNLNINFLFGFSLSIMFCRQTSVFWKRLERNAESGKLKNLPTSTKSNGSNGKDKQNSSNKYPKKLKAHLTMPPTYASLKQNIAQGGLELGYGDFRIMLLDELEELGYNGFYSLLYTSMRKLMERKKSNDDIAAAAATTATSTKSNKLKVTSKKVSKTISRQVSSSSSSSSSSSPLLTKKKSKSKMKSK